MSIALIAVEGVLGESSVIHGFYPIREGVRLAHALRSGYRIALGTVQADADSVEHWLHINGMVKPSFYDNLMYREARWADLSDPELLAAQALKMRAAGDLDLVVSSDAESVLHATEMGIPTIFFVNPSYRWAEYRPDKKKLPVPWQKIEDETIRQMELRAGDPRLSEEEEVERI